ncbi:DUF58 domain-containing protein [Agromyces silvae]|uniref:DUF58 domain-containing protein n=1 Tax=Agromyces silvae TaxID=3388266 RepID=UPI00280B7B38|nr:DUF58 domain-containing protein [Agromyces protaetiae]
MTTTDQGPAPRISQTRIAFGTVGGALSRAFAGLGARAASAGRRVASAARPVTGVISTIGWLVLAASLIAGLVALVFGWVEFAFLSATLAGAVLVAVPFVFGRMRYRVTVELTPRRVVAGERAYGRLVVVNDGTTPSVSSRVELPVGDGSAEFRIPPLAPAAEHEELFAVPTHRRAVIVAGPAVSVRGDELGLLRRTVRWNDPVELFVHPRTARLKPSAAGLVRDLEGEITKTITDHDISFHALRAYEPGDPLRNVHWRSSARTGRLMVRQYEETRRSELVLLQATATDHYADEDEFELAVSVFASIGVQVIRDRTKITARTEGQRLRTSTPTSLLDDASRIDSTAAGSSLREFVRETVRRTPAASVVMLVVGSGAALAEVRSVETVLPSDAQLFVFRAQRDTEAKIARIGGTAVATVGELGELPAVIRKVRP